MVEAWAALHFQGTFHRMWDSALGSLVNLMPMCWLDKLSRIPPSILCAAVSSSHQEPLYQRTRSSSTDWLQPAVLWPAPRSRRHLWLSLETLTNIPGLLSFWARGNMHVPSPSEITCGHTQILSLPFATYVTWTRRLTSLNPSFHTSQIRKIYLIQMMFVRVKWVCKAPRRDTCKMLFSFSFSPYYKQNPPLVSFHSTLRAYSLQEAWGNTYSRSVIVDSYKLLFPIIVEEWARIIFYKVFHFQLLAQFQDITYI